MANAFDDLPPGLQPAPAPTGRFDVAGARAAGYTDAEIAQYMRAQGPQATARQAAPGLYDDLATPGAAVPARSAPAGAGLYDDLAPRSIALRNAFDDITPPPAAAREAAKPPATWQDRLQAGEAGVLRGGAYMAGLIPDTILNALSVGQAALGTGVSLARSSEEQAPARTPGGLYRYLTPEGIERFSKEPPPPGAKPVTIEHPGQVPSWLQVDQPVSPVGAALARLMDKSPITTTQPTRPYDTVSRYLATAGSVVPGAILGGGGALGPTVRALVGALP